MSVAQFVDFKGSGEGGQFTAERLEGRAQLKMRFWGRDLIFRFRIDVRIKLAIDNSANHFQFPFIHSNRQM